MKFFSTFIRFLLIGNFLFFSLSFAANKNVIYIYNDKGVSQNSFLQAMHTFQSLVPSTFKVKPINAISVINNNWSHDAALFIMPGGADLPYNQKLKSVGNFNIKTYVNNGGSYLGFCAGAYYASANVEFDKNGPLEVMGTRELAFFEGTSVGPVLAKYDYKTQSGARAAKITLTSPWLDKVSFYYNGGGYFKNAETVKNVNVMGYYQNKKPAIISITYGKGQVVLSGVHFEYDSKLLDPNDPLLSPLIPVMSKYNTQRLNFTKDILKYLNIKI